jgi:hypothetical protein
MILFLVLGKGKFWGLRVFIATERGEKKRERVERDRAGERET